MSVVNSGVLETVLEGSSKLGVEVKCDAAVVANEGRDVACVVFVSEIDTIVKVSDVDSC